MIQAVKPWMSEKNIDRGTVWLIELAKALESIKLGVICLTRESLSEPWVLFENGVIFKGLDESRVWTYLLGGLKPSEVPQQDLLNRAWDAVFDSRFIKGGSIIYYLWLKRRLNHIGDFLIR